MTAPLPPGQDSPKLTETPHDLGLGRVVAEQSGERFLNKDGSFNVQRRGMGWQSISLYGALLTVPWNLFFLTMGALYLALNALFGLIYFGLGSGALSEEPLMGMGRYLACFFFSVQTFGTIGYGHVYPLSVAANTVVTVEAFVSLLGVALATGVLFARFSRPQSRILFSQVAVIAPFEGGKALMFRLINGRRSQLMNAKVEAVHTQFETLPDGRRVRRFKRLQLERAEVTLFPLAWTVVHPITQDSPYWHTTLEALREADAEIMVVFSATDEAVQQNIHARSSYKIHEFRWNHRFADLYRRTRDGHLYVDAERLHDTEAILEEVAPSLE
ncbi:transporter [Deinococcus psychrotolerans]|uniref:Transporter n=1 Tax=Deinococcus psychrotolerans TaxID=2489213 RepID=A0A3G8YLU7_9DEIO|nr:ion channel [Deinococcus psychrotolerans]AZI42601.1 transporter [Deinococcus psychrotolerans]